MNFCIIIGGSRCGSTSLFKYISQLENIIPAYEKETRFFLSEDYPIDRNSSIPYSSKIEDYLKFFVKKNEANDYYLDASPDYLYDEKSAHRIFELSNNHQVKLICIVRDPRDRFISWFNHDKQQNAIPQETPFSEYFEKNIDGTKPPFNRLDTGLFSKHLDKYSQNKNILLVNFNDLGNNTEQVINEINNFLGNKKIDSSIIDYTKHNASHKVRFPLLVKAYHFVRKNIYNKLNLNSQLFKFFKWLMKFYKKVNFVEIESTLSNQDQKLLNDYFSDEIKELEMKYQIKF